MSHLITSEDQEWARSAARILEEAQPVHVPGVGYAVTISDELRREWARRLDAIGGAK
jgi:hypothetical protein